MRTEIRILDWIQSIRTPSADILMCFVTQLGNAGIIWILLAVILIFLPKKRKSGAILEVASFAAVAALYLAGEKKIWKPALVFAVFMAFSRLYLYVHYPTDIFGGIIVGIAAGYIGYQIIRKLQKSNIIV